MQLLLLSAASRHLVAFQPENPPLSRKDFSFQAVLKTIES
jgi:hypothetical protein